VDRKGIDGTARDKELKHLASYLLTLCLLFSLRRRSSAKAAAQAQGSHAFSSLGCGLTSVLHCSNKNLSAILTSSPVPRSKNRASKLTHRAPPSLARGMHRCLQQNSFGRKSPDIGYPTAPSATNRHRSAASRTPSEHHFDSLIAACTLLLLFSDAACEGPAPGR
jgi:hypothetical protein